MSAISQNQAIVDAWNDQYGIGQLVEATIDEKKMTTRTRTEASLVYDIPIIWVHGHDKPIKLTDVKRMKDD